MTRPWPIAAAPLALLLALVLTTPALAADPVAINGTVRNADASPAGGSEVLVTVEGSDEAWPATADDTGAFTVDVPLAVGDTIHVRATSPTIRSEPDQDGCVTTSSSSGTVTLEVDSLPLDDVQVILDQAISSIVCPTTGTPDPTAEVTPTPHRTPHATTHANVTPPPTDSAGGPTSGIGTGLLPTLLLLATGSALILLATRVRRT